MRINYSLPCILLMSICALLSSCNVSKEKQSDSAINKESDKKAEDGYAIISAELVKKNFVNKAGETSDIAEWYVRRSAGDYFIKFCESNVTPQEIEEALAKEEGLIKTLTLKVDFLEGEWDICEPSSIAQSRVGAYVAIKAIM